MATRHQIEQVLNEAGEPYQVLPLGGASLLVTQRGGRAFPFIDADADCLLWVNPVLTDSARFEAFRKAGEWNLGGNRLWIAPEIQYNVKDRADFWGTLSVPPEFDPGRYTIAAETLPNDQSFVRLSMNNLTLQAYNLGAGTQRLSIERHYEFAPNPLRTSAAYESLMRDVAYVGYRQVVSLDGEHSNAATEAWDLAQLHSGGQLFIPCLPEVEATDYFGSIPEEARLIHREDGACYLRLNISGARQYKVGYKAFCMSGKMGYFNILPDGNVSLLIRSFFNDPSNSYSEEPPFTPGANGHSVHVYNDDGGMGGFGEMECTGKTIRGGSSYWQSQTQDTFTFWGYVGSPDSVRDIGRRLLGITF